VESGLNDGIVTPIVFIALSGLENAGQHFHAEDVLNQAIYPFLIAVAIAVVVGPLHAILVDTSYAREWTTAEGRKHNKLPSYATLIKN
jgi:NhaP-type Na+/H+ or K+/H+ antiporter